MKILLVNPRSDFLTDAKVFPPLGLMYLSAYLKKHGYTDITILDMADHQDGLLEVDADIVGFYSNTPQFPAAVRISQYIKSINKNSSALYVFGGPHVSGKPEDVSWNDVIVVGEGEGALLDIVRRRERGEQQSQLVQFPYIKDLNTIPFPDRDIIDISTYKYYLDGKLSTTLISSRGCPFGCYFCSNNVWGKTLRMRSPENVYEELKLLKYKYGFDSFMFYDDTITVDRGRMEKMCELIKSLDIIYRCNIRSDTVDLDILKKMRESGCVEAGIGIESGSQRILDIVNKKETIAENLAAVKACHEAGIRIKGFLIVGLPGENRESIEETKRFCDEAKFDDIDFTVYSPFPGSYIYRNKDKFDIDFKDDYEASWYKGITGNYKSLSCTSGLSKEEIVSVRDNMELSYKKRG